MSSNVLVGVQRPDTAPPITIPISSTPTRLSVLSPPYTVINLSTGTDDTIWLADNPGVQVNLGTPLYPGTSLQWNRPGSLWAVCSANISTLLQISYDVTDWEPNPIALATAILNSGMLLVDQPVVVFDDEIAMSQQTELIDTSRYQNCHIHLEPMGTITYPTTSTVTIEMSIDGMHILRRLAVGFGELTFWHTNLPIVGNRLLISVSTAGGSDFHCVVVLSHRPLRTIQDVTFIPGAFVPRINHLWFRIPIALAAGTTLDLDSIPPYFGQANLTVLCTAGAPPTNIDTRVVLQESVNSLNRFRWIENTWNVVGTNSSMINATITLSGNAIRLSITNAEAASQTFAVWLTPVYSPGGDF